MQKIIVFYTKQSKRGCEDRENKIYVSWTDTTLERYESRRELIEWAAYSGNKAITANHPEQQDTYEEYLKKLATHKYVLSPPGNGADCYRTLESVYMGCLTFVKDTPTNYLTKLPVFRYTNINDVIGYYNENHQMSNGSQEQPETKLSHWKELIHSKRSELF